MQGHYNNFKFFTPTWPNLWCHSSKDFSSTAVFVSCNDLFIGLESGINSFPSLFPEPIMQSWSSSMWHLSSLKTVVKPLLELHRQRINSLPSLEHTKLPTTLQAWTLLQLQLWARLIIYHVRVQLCYHLSALSLGQANLCSSPSNLCNMSCIVMHQSVYTIH